MKDLSLIAPTAIPLAINRPLRGALRLRRNHLLAAIALIASISSIPTDARAQPTTGAGRIEARLLGLASDVGTARCRLFASEDGWPEDGSKAFRQASSEIRQHQAVCIFENVPPGTYAITAIQDRNWQWETRQKLPGHTHRALQFLQDARGMMSPAKFSAASFHYPGGVLNLASR